ncbi:hypothetical protein [Roseovarius pacificus]|nr:hypothetical protein [Roseovarius pacificus]
MSFFRYPSPSALAVGADCHAAAWLLAIEEFSGGPEDFAATITERNSQYPLKDPKFMALGTECILWGQTPEVTMNPRFTANPTQERDKDGLASGPARLPRRFRAFYRLSDTALEDLGLDRQDLPIFNPVQAIRREDLF